MRAVLYYRFGVEPAPFQRGLSTVSAWECYRFGLDGQRTLEILCYRCGVEKNEWQNSLLI